MLKNSTYSFFKSGVFTAFLALSLTAEISQNANAAVSVPFDLTSIGTTYTVKNDIPPRLQWGANYGYCGEVSMISAGLYYGQYLSQYDVRDIASPGIAQNSEDSQLLLGKNDGAAAKRLRLAYELKSTSSNSDFYAWIKRHVVQGHPVITGIFTNTSNGDTEYDHIVPVVGFGSNYPLKNGYYVDDVIVFSDNYYTPKSATPYYYSLEIGSFLANPQTENADIRDIYSLPDNPITKYAIAITGVMDTKNETLPVRVSTYVNSEPDMKEGTTARPKSSLLTLTVTVSNLKSGVSYNLYSYSSESEVPIENFNANSKKAGILPWKVIKISSGTTWKTTLTNVKSSSKVFFRAVKATTP